MSHDPSEVQVTVIDEDLIYEAIKEDEARPDREQKGGDTSDARENRLRTRFDEEDIDFREVSTLRLTFKNILKIDNLIGFDNLRVLCLDNNVIEDIENLDKLTNLEWLDLSFNNITEIKGLDKLTKLKDLSLFNNRIEKIENLDNCPCLECISIGNNEIRAVESIMYLRQFKKLRLVNFERNPVCAESDYRMYTLAFLKNLVYLDYALVNPDEVMSAKEQYQDELIMKEEAEAIDNQAMERDQQGRDKMEMLAKANLTFVETLFDDMFKEDNEMAKIKILPGIRDLVHEFREKFKQESQEYRKFALELNTEKDAEKVDYEKAAAEVMRENEAKAIKLIETFNRKKKHIFRDFNLMEEQRTMAMARHVEPLQELLVQNKALGDTLMSLEMLQVEQLDDHISTYETRADRIKAKIIDHQQQYFRLIEEMEDAYCSALVALALDQLEKFNGDLLGEIPEDLKTLLSDKDMLIGSCQGSHDIHVGKLLACEDKVRDKANAQFTLTVDMFRKRDNDRNRARVSEISLLLQRNQEQIQEMLAEEQLEDDDQL